MQRTPRQRDAWGIMLVWALILLGCSSNPPRPLTGTWTGTIQDSVAGRGTLMLRLSQVEMQLTGTWQMTFPDAQHNNGGTLTGTGIASDLAITMVWSTTQANACSFTVTAMLDNNNEDRVTGTYAPFNCAQPESGSFDVMRQ
jgi:hypothetical protein